MRLTFDRLFPAALFAPLLALAAACGGGAAATDPATAPTSSAMPAATDATPAASASASAAAATPGPLPTVWSDSMPKDQQMAFMKQNVMPAEGPLFKAHDSTRYADFSCKTCHGPAYKNPHEFLPPLTMKGGKITAFAEKPEVAKFMAESVTPKMAAAMGEPPYDPKTNTGFGCGGCHKINMQ